LTNYNTDEKNHFLRNLKLSIVPGNKSVALRCLFLGFDSFPVIEANIRDQDPVSEVIQLGRPEVRLPETEMEGDDSKRL